MNGISPEAVTQVAWLSRLHLDGEALSRLTGQLEEILAYVQQLQQVPTDGIEPTSHVIPLANVLREDTPIPSLPQAAVLALAPGRRAPFITVPKILESG